MGTINGTVVTVVLLLLSGNIIPCVPCSAKCLAGNPGDAQSHHFSLDRMLHTTWYGKWEDRKQANLGFLIQKVLVGRLLGTLPCPS